MPLDFIQFVMSIQPEVPQGQSREEIRQREKFIKDFYANWIAINPTKHIYNIALNDFIHVRFLSIQETAEYAAFTFKIYVGGNLFDRNIGKSQNRKACQAQTKQSKSKTILRNNHHAI